ncbi:MAG: hypothetical protein LBP53_08800 [Candidatus Peribacteria bacterium]|jgi:hypothetical protein|nr:hypothetical protein [Candidatus Peribacteria bacterium]
MELGLDISKFWNKDGVASRGNVMMLLYNAYNGGKGTTGKGNVEDILQQIVDILEE